MKLQKGLSIGLQMDFYVNIREPTEKEQDTESRNGDTSVDESENLEISNTLEYSKLAKGPSSHSQR